MQKALDKTNWIREQIVSLNADFGEMAARYSDDIDTATAEGYLGDLVRGQAVEAFDEAAFALKQGEISAPVRTYMGFHLVKLLSRNPSRPLTFEEAFGENFWKELCCQRKTLMFSDWLPNSGRRLGKNLDPELSRFPGSLRWISLLTGKNRNRRCGLFSHLDDRGGALVWWTF